MWVGSVQLDAADQCGPLVLGQREDSVPERGGAGKLLLLAFLCHLPVDVLPGSTVSAIAVSGAGFAFDVRAIVAPGGGVVSVGAAVGVAGDASKN